MGITCRLGAVRCYRMEGGCYDVLSAKWPNYGFRVVALGGSAAE